MSTEIAFVERLTNAVVEQLGPVAPDWQIATIGYLQIDNETIDSSEPTNTIRVSLNSRSTSYTPITIDFSLDVPLPDATREAADQLQDHSVEAIHGGSVPPCPGHRHPLTPRLVDGVPKWICLQDGPAYYASAILPRFDPRYSLTEYMQENPAPAC